MEVGSSSNNPEVAHHLKEAARRISAIARVHRRLYETNRVESVDLGPYLEDLCRDMQDSAPSCQIHVEAAAGITVPTNQAINIGIVVSELVTNATKHAYPGSSEQQVWVTVSGAACSTGCQVGCGGETGSGSTRVGAGSYACSRASRVT